MHDSVSLLGMLLLAGVATTDVAAADAAAILGDSTNVSPDQLCTYCRDYREATNSQRAFRSSYRPGTGYAPQMAIGVVTVEPSADSLAARMLADRRPDLVGGDSNR